MTIARKQSRRSSAQRVIGLCLCALLLGHLDSAAGHVFVDRSLRTGAYPPRDGTGWLCEVFLDVPNFDLRHAAVLTGCMSGPNTPAADGCIAGDRNRNGFVDLRDFARFQTEFFRPRVDIAEGFTIGRQPDFTFRTVWVDFPAGPVDAKPDTAFVTMGDFLDNPDYPIFDVSNPAKLDEPFGSFVLKFKGQLKVRLADESRVRDLIELPVWVDLGTLGYDGYRTSVGETIYGVGNANLNNQEFSAFGPSIEAFGLYPVEVVYFNSYDPQGRMGNPLAGVELYSWHGGGLPWPRGQEMVHEIRGPATLVPPRVIYQPEDALPVATGDFEADFDIDLRDFQFFTICADPNNFIPPIGCSVFNFGGSFRIELDDLAAFEAAMKGPGVAPVIQPGP